MKRINDLFEKICSIENLKLADKKARKGKTNQRSIINHDLNREDNIINLHHILLNKEYTTSQYKIFKIYDPKEREIYRLPYYPDRIIQHAILNILEPIFLSIFISNTFNCIKERGIHGALESIKSSFKNKEGTKYCLKFDIKQFYPSIDHNILKFIIRRKIKDKDLLWLLDDIIDSSAGLPIGNYLSQYLANLYLTYFDHWIKEVKKVKYYFRYCDDIVILSDNKDYLRELFKEIKQYFNKNLKLEIKSNYQIFPIFARGLDFVGYKTFHTHILLRKRIKKKFINMIKYNKNSKSINSYNGWLAHCNSINLKQKYLC